MVAELFDCVLKRGGANKGLYIYKGAHRTRPPHATFL